MDTVVEKRSLFSCAKTERLNKFIKIKNGRFAAFTSIYGRFETGRFENRDVLEIGHFVGVPYNILYFIEKGRS